MAMNLHDTPAGTPEAPFDVLVVGASAGGLPALADALRAMPPDFPLPIILAMHLSTDSDACGYLQRLGFRASWARPGARWRGGQVMVCPPGWAVELRPDGEIALFPTSNSAADRPVDRLLASAAHSFGARAIGVILSGMGNDGAAGARRLRQAGGPVLVQMPSSAQHDAMPLAAVEAGGASIVAPPRDMGGILSLLLEGAA